MPHSALLDDLIYSAHQGAGFILRRCGRVVPGGIYFVDADDPRMDFCFPKEDHPRASDEEVLALVEAELRRWAARPQTCAIAMVTEIVRDPATALRASGGQRVMALQAETRGELVVMHVPLRRKLWWWTLGEPEVVEGLIVPRFFGEDAAPADAKEGAGY
jgi:hypothetical protein